MFSSMLGSGGTQSKRCAVPAAPSYNTVNKVRRSADSYASRSNAISMQYIQDLPQGPDFVQMPVPGVNVEFLQLVSKYAPLELGLLHTASTQHHPATSGRPSAAGSSAISLKGKPLSTRITDEQPGLPYSRHETTEAANMPKSLAPSEIGTVAAANQEAHATIQPRSVPQSALGKTIAYGGVSVGAAIRGNIRKDTKARQSFYYCMHWVQWY